MQLILWRHAEAEDEAASDMARQLTGKGQDQARKMAEWLATQADVSEKGWRVIASPAVRTRQTADALGVAYETVPGIAPDVGADAVLNAADWPGGERNVLVVGHQPTLGMVASYLMNGTEGYVAVKKGAMWWFEMRTRDGEQQCVLKAMASPEMMG